MRVPLYHKLLEWPIRVITGCITYIIITSEYLITVFFYIKQNMTFN